MLLTAHKSCLYIKVSRTLHNLSFLFCVLSEQSTSYQKPSADYETVLVFPPTFNMPPSELVSIAVDLPHLNFTSTIVEIPKIKNKFQFENQSHGSELNISNVVKKILDTVRTKNFSEFEDILLQGMIMHLWRAIHGCLIQQQT